MKIPNFTIPPLFHFPFSKIANFISLYFSRTTIPHRHLHLPSLNSKPWQSLPSIADHHQFWRDWPLSRRNMPKIVSSLSPTTKFSSLLSTFDFARRFCPHFFSFYFMNFLFTYVSWVFFFSKKNWHICSYVVLCKRKLVLFDKLTYTFSCTVFFQRIVLLD